ncbi:plasmid replication protein, CyRepA1 family [Nodularia chucula]|uniref:plasmid replication protein, CyRepA1 family n=1 Tax=Nodularia chucula TaxID=3093667 RepID=UPI0039C5B6EF
MSKLIPTTKANPCPSCGDTQGRCRHHADGEIILCMTANSQRKGDIVENGYKVIGFEKGGLWAILKLDNSQEWSEERRREWEDRKQAAKLAAIKVDADKKEKCLDIPTRHGLYSKILNSLQLDIPTIGGLKARGFTPEEIADCGFKPVEKYHRLGFSIDSRLPGIGADRRSLITSGDGYLCPLRDYDGNITAMQLRLNHAADGGRYRWVSSPAQTLAVQIGDRLENPLAVFKPEKPEGIAIAEGTGVKPYLTSRRLNQIVIGAAGGQFAGSPKLLEEYLSRASQDVDSKDVIIYPDAGDVQNKAVSKRWQEVAILISGFGYNIKFAWWGQTTKEHNDIDELNDYSQLQFISIDEFKKLIHPSLPVQKQKPVTEAGQAPPQWHDQAPLGRGVGCGVWGVGGKIAPTTSGSQASSSQDDCIGGGSKPRPIPSSLHPTPYPQHPIRDQVVAVQKKLHTLTYTPDYVCDPSSKYLPEELSDIIPRQGIVLLNAPKGSGKSVSIKRIKDKFCGGYWEEIVKPPSQLSLVNVEPEIEKIYHEKTGVKFISITARIALGRAQAIEWDITWIEDGDLTKSEQYDYEGELLQTATFLETAEGINLCWDSLSKLFDRDWSNSIVVIDEIELGLSHVATSSTCKDRRSKILSTLETKLKECLDGNGLVIGADADLTDISYDYLSAICPGHKPFIIKKDYIRPDADKWDITFYSGKRDEIISQIEEWVSDKDCEPIAVATDNQAETEALANHLIKKYPHLAANHNGLIRIDSKVTQSDFGKSFVKRANQKIQEHQPKILIYTPSLGVGCSLDIPYFKYVYGMFFGNLEPSQCRQMLARVRQPVPRIIWCAERGKVSNGDDFNSFMPEAIKKQIFNYNDLTTQVIDIALYLAKQQAEGDSDAEILPKLIENLQSMMGSTGSWDNPHIDLFCKLKARRNFALSQLSLQLRQELIDEGHIINDYAIEGKTNAGDCVREEKTEIKLNKALMTSKSDDIPLELAKEINRKPNPTDEEQHQVSKAFLKDELPEVDLNPDFIYKAIYKDNRRWLNSVKLFWMTQNVDATKEADRKHWKYKLKQFCDGVAYLPDIRTYSAKVQAINSINLFEAIPLDDFETEYYNDSEVLKEWFKKSVLPHRKLLKNAFNISVNKDTQVIKFINQMLSKVGIKLKQARKSDGIKYYSLDAELATDADRAEVLRSLDLKREMQLAAVVEPTPELLAQPIPAPMPAPFIADPDLIAPLVAEQMLKLSTREEFKELAETITPEQKAAAWKLIPIEQRRQIQALFREDIQKPETGTVSSLELELPPTDPTTLLHRVEMLRSGIKQGIDAIKNILKPWNEIWRWETVLEWEAIALDELLKVEDTVPGFYQLLSEAVLPMEANG